MADGHDRAGRGNREVRLGVLGPAHTPGDIAFFYVSPLAHEGTLKGWVKACDRILEWM